MFYRSSAAPRASLRGASVFEVKVRNECKWHRGSSLDPCSTALDQVVDDGWKDSAQSSSSAGAAVER
ncbi:hypothetical protein GN956_G3388 [Arapaima gigas]